MSLAAESGKVLPLPRRAWRLLVETDHFEAERLELIHGEIVVMSPQRSDHLWVVNEVAEILRIQLSPGWRVLQHSPFAAGETSEPEPDICVAEKGWDVPKQSPLIVEVTGSSRKMDLDIKPRVYGAAGVPVYAVVDLRDRVLHVHTRPTDEGYLDKRVLEPGEPLRLTDPDLVLDIADVLPPI